MSFIWPKTIILIVLPLSISYNIFGEKFPINTFFTHFKSDDGQKLKLQGNRTLSFGELVEPVAVCVVPPFQINDCGARDKLSYCRFSESLQSCRYFEGITTTVVHVLMQIYCFSFSRAFSYRIPLHFRYQPNFTLTTVFRFFFSNS